MKSAVQPDLGPQPGRRWVRGVYVATAVSLLSLVALPFSDPRAALLLWLAVLCLLPYLLVLERLRAGDRRRGLALAMVSAPGALLCVLLGVPRAAPSPSEPRWLATAFLAFALAQGLLLVAAIGTYRSMGRQERGRVWVGFPLPTLYFALVAVFFLALDSHRRQHSNTASALATLRTLREALHSYKEQCGGFPEALDRAAPSVSAEEPDCTVAVGGRIHTLLQIARSGQSHGYAFDYRPRHRAFSNDNRPLLYEGYEVRADPVTRGETGFASFWLSEDGRIHENWSAPAGPSDHTRD